MKPDQPTNHSSYFINKDCEFFPCHETDDRDSFNCLFCYCPLYALGDQCGGRFSYTPEGVKDCSNCLLPHEKGGYAYINRNIGRVLELTRRGRTGGEQT